MLVYSYVLSTVRVRQESKTRAMGKNLISKIVQDIKTL